MRTTKFTDQKKIKVIYKYPCFYIAVIDKRGTHCDLMIQATRNQYNPSKQMATDFEFACLSFTIDYIKQLTTDEVLSYQIERLVNRVLEMSRKVVNSC